MSLFYQFINVDNRLMTQVYPLELIFNYESIQQFRTKEILMFFLGYAISYLRNISKNTTNKNLFDISFHHFVNSLFDQTINPNKSITKQTIYDLFVTLLYILEKSQSTIQSLSLTYEQLYKIFSQFLAQAFRTLERKQLFQTFNHILLNNLAAKIQTHTQISVQIPQFKKKPKKQHIYDTEISNSENSNKICEICCIPLNIFQTSQIKAEKNEIVTITKCGHQYHRNCLFETIKNHMNENSSIIQILNNKKNEPDYQASFDPITIVKCPQFEKCGVNLKFSEIHDILLNVNRQNSLQQIEKLDEIALNDFINSRDVKPFQQIGSFLNMDIKGRQEKGIIFFCHTKGCNAIYEIDRELIKENVKSQSSIELQNFTCLSCNQSFCLKCFNSIHPMMTCKQFAISSSYLPQDLELEKFIKTLRRPYMKCPKCHFYVDNWRGCSTITCRCGIRFCYKCGGTDCPYAKCLKQMEKQADKNDKKEK